MNLNEIEREYFVKKKDGMSFSHIRKDLEDKGLSNEQISVIIRSIDHKIITDEVSKSNKSIGKQMIFMGLVLTSLGLFITIATYSGFIDMGDQYLLSYGPIFGGIGLIAIGLNRR